MNETLHEELSCINFFQTRHLFVTCLDADGYHLTTLVGATK